MYFVQLITQIIIGCLKKNKEEELDGTTLGYRLSPFSLTYLEAVTLSKALVEQCKLMDNTDIQICISIRANDEDIVKSDTADLNFVNITNSKQAAEKATLYRNDEDRSNTLYISYKQWGKEGGLRDTLEDISPLFSEEELLKVIEQLLKKKEKLYQQLLVMFADNDFPHPSTREFCYLLDAIDKTFDRDKPATSWKQAGLELFRLGLPKDPHLTEDNSSQRIKRATQLLNQALGNSNQEFELKEAEAIWIEEAEHKILFEQDEEAILHIDLPQNLSIKEKKNTI